MPRKVRESAGAQYLAGLIETARAEEAAGNPNAMAEMRRRLRADLEDARDEKRAESDRLDTMFGKMPKDDREKELGMSSRLPYERSHSGDPIQRADLMRMLNPRWRKALKRGKVPVPLCDGFPFGAGVRVVPVAMGSRTDIDGWALFLIENKTGRGWDATRAAFQHGVLGGGTAQAFTDSAREWAATTPEKQREAMVAEAFPPPLAKPRRVPKPASGPQAEVIQRKTA